MKLLVSKHGQQLSEYEFPTTLGIEQVEIGRSQNSHVLIDDPMISRDHAKLELIESKWKLIKVAMFGELNLNGKDCSQSFIEVGDLIELGDFSIKIKSLGDNKTKDNTNSSAIEETPIVSDELEPEADLDKTEIQDFVDNSSADDYQHDSYDDSSNLSDDSNDSEESFSDSFSDDEFDSENQDDDFGFDDGGFSSDDNGGFDGDDKTGVFTGFATFYLKIFGENTSYDRFKIPNGETKIGRKSEECEIVIPEDDVSGVHAVIKKNMVSCTLEDLNSANGTILNGERVNKAELVNGDEFVIGSTTFTVEVISDLIQEEKGRLMPVEPNQEITVEEIVEEEVDFGELGDVDSASVKTNESKSLFKNPEKRKKLIYAVVGLLLLWVLLDDGESSSPSKKTKDDKTSKQKNVKQEDAKQVKADPNKKVYTKEQLEQLESSYQIGVRYFEEANFVDARSEFSRVASIEPTYKNVETYIQQTDQALKRLSEAEEERRRKEERLILEAKVKELMNKANKAFLEKNIELTRFYINKVAEMDPENLELPYLKVELETYINKKRAEEEKARIRKEARDKMLAELKPGEAFFFRREWYKAILKLEAFTRLNGIDNDLIEKASSMIRRARYNLKEEVDPLLGEARSLREGQDLKGAYELYAKIYDIDQSNVEVLNEMEDIRTRLQNRSKKVYREALIAESLSLFDEAKEKFQQVQQISPSDSEYYKKASEKLKNYFE